MAGERWRLGRRPALDGLRGVAVVLVVVYHVFGASFPAGGIVGVTTFFTLSGFLITSLLLEERDRSGRVDLRAFYRRRALRLFPALFVMLAVVGPIAIEAGYLKVSSLVVVALYSANWWSATGHNLGLLMHTWTLATEEQFYLLWPLALLALRRSRHAFTIVATAAVALPFLGVLGSAVSSAAVLAGCALALWFHQRPRVRELPAGVLPVLLIALVGASWLRTPGVATVIITTALAVATVYTVAASRTRVPVLASSVARAVGRRSYGLYLWHLPVITFAVAVGSRSGLAYWQSAGLSLPVLAALVELSWRYLEQPFLRLKNVPAVARVPVAAS